MSKTIDQNLIYCIKRTKIYIVHACYGVLVLFNWRLGFKDIALKDNFE